MPIPGFKVLTKDGLKGPYQKSSVIKAITSAQIPLTARLLDMETGKYLSAAELVGEEAEAKRPPRPLEQYDPDVTMPMQQDPPSRPAPAKPQAKPAAKSETKSAPKPSEPPPLELSDDSNELRL